jgi:hypothetical protein
VSYLNVSDDGSNVTVLVHKAQQTGETPTPRLTLLVDEELPEITAENWREIGMHTYQTDARFIELALNRSLPGGVYDAVLRAMLLRKASHFRVPFGDHNPIPETVPEPAPVGAGV